VLYLGHPSYATTIVLGSLLVGAGVGSALAARIPSTRARSVALMAPLVVAVMTLALVGSIAEQTLMQPFMVRAALSSVVIFITGISLGLLLPLGMSQFDDRDRSWYWAVNGAAGVLASVLALVLALLVGFAAVLWCGALCYLVAGLTLPRVRTSSGSGRDAAL
jgi:hypothetical protein